MSADPTERWLQDANKMKKILLILYLGQVSWIVLNEKKKVKKFSFKKPEEKVAKSHYRVFFCKG